jgi:hypothetical protein
MIGVSGTEGGSGGSGAAIATGGGSPAIAKGGKSPMNATGGSPAIATGGKGAMNATGGSPAIATGGRSPMNATGGNPAIATGGKGAMNATGGSGASGTTGGSASGGSGGSTGITSCNDSFPYLATWEGNILDFYFEPTQALKLELYADASGRITGKLTWGEGAPPPAPESADIPYPPGYWEQQSGMMPVSAAPEPWPGLAYTIVRGAGCDTTFRFAVSTAELWQDWCALQTPVYTPDYGWGCTLRGGGSSDGKTCTIQPPTGAWATYPMWKCEACGAFGFNGVCACDQNGCFADMTATHTFNLTYSVSGGAEILSGPDPSCGDCTVRLARKN